VTVACRRHTRPPIDVSIVSDLRTEFDWLGYGFAVLPEKHRARLPRFAASGARIRLCKGATTTRRWPIAPGRGHRLLSTMPAGADGWGRLSDGRPPTIANHRGGARDDREMVGGGRRFRVPDVYGHQRRRAARRATSGNNVRRSTSVRTAVVWILRAEARRAPGQSDVLLRRGRTPN